MPKTTTEQQQAQQQIEPRGTQTGRMYRIMLKFPTEIARSYDEEAEIWRDSGYFPGSSPEAAIKRARAGDPRLLALIAEGHEIVAIPESNFNPVKRTIETVEKESFQAVPA